MLITVSQKGRHDLNYVVHSHDPFELEHAYAVDIYRHWSPASHPPQSQNCKQQVAHGVNANIHNTLRSCYQDIGHETILVRTVQLGTKHCDLNFSVRKKEFRDKCSEWKQSLHPANVACCSTFITELQMVFTSVNWP